MSIAFSSVNSSVLIELLPDARILIRKNDVVTNHFIRPYAILTGIDVLAKRRKESVLSPATGSVH